MKHVAGSGSGLRKFNNLDAALLAAVKNALRNEKSPGEDPESKVFVQNAKGEDVRVITVTVRTEDSSPPSPPANPSVHPEEHVEEIFAAQPLPRQPDGLLMPPRPQGRCRSASDGDCDWPGCPQLRDGEPAKTGRACPLLEKHAKGTPVYAPHVRPRVSPETRAGEILASESDGPMSNLLHTLWTKAVGSPEYDKWEWQALEMILNKLWAGQDLTGQTCTVS